MKTEGILPKYLHFIDFNLDPDADPDPERPCNKLNLYLKQLYLHADELYDNCKDNLGRTTKAPIQKGGTLFEGRTTDRRP